MPGLDGTGPQGRGRITGRGLGLCTGYAKDGELPPRFGVNGGGRRAQGFGGRGRGRMNMFYVSRQPGWVRDMPAQTDGEPDLQQLENQARLLEDDLKQLRQRIRDLKEDK